jgi:DNA-binding NarL/FixJ family response regulator
MSRGFVGHQRQRPTLLIADDDPVVRSMLSMSLDERFEIVAVVEDGAQAVELAKKHKPEAALIDVEMPGGGGPTAVRGIAQESPETAIVVLSSDESDALVRDLLLAGAMSYCRKGISPQDLSEAIEGSIRALRREQDAMMTTGLTDH